MSFCRITRGIFLAPAVVLLAAGMASSSGLRTTAMPALQVAPGLVAHFPLDSALTPQSDVGGTHQLTLQPAASLPTATTGVFGGGINLDGANDYLEIADANDLDFGAGDFTVALWCKPDTTNALRLMNKWDGPLQQGWLLDVHSRDGGNQQTGSLRFMLDTNSAANTANVDRHEVFVQNAIDTGAWRHVAVTVNRTAREIRFFVDGNQVGATSVIAAGFAGSVSNAFTVGVGMIPSSTPAKWFDGAVDDVKLYNRSLAANEVNALYNNGFIAIGVGNPGPVVPQRGLLAEYYNSTTNLATSPTPASPTSVMTPTDANSTFIVRRIEGPIDSALVTGTSRPAGVNDDNFYVEWSGYIQTIQQGDYNITMRVDDGGRLWFNQTPLTTTPNQNQWFTQAPKYYHAAAAGLTQQTKYPVRFEMFEAGVTQYAGLLWVLPGQPVPDNTVPDPPPPSIPKLYLSPPDGPDAPGGLNATATPNNPTAQVTVSWNTSTTPVTATSYILSRATTSGGPYTQVAVQATTNFTDNTVAFGTTYYYVVQGTAAGGLRVGPPSAETTGVTPSQPALSISPTTALVTDEGTLDDTFTITVNAVPTSDVTVQITSSDPGEALLSGNGPSQSLQGPGSPISILIPSGTAVNTTITITVDGQPDFVQDGPQNYTISFVVTGGGTPYSGLTIAPLNGTTSDGDTAGITVTQLSGPTTESGGTATFIVVFQSKPAVDTTVTVTSTNTAEATVSASQVFSSSTVAPNPTAWNVSHIFTVTGVDDALLDFDQPFSVNVSVSGGDPVYVAMTAGGPIVRNGLNLDNETIPTLEPVWGGGGGGGGCGLTGLEAGLLLGLAALLRRRHLNA
jgi:hypothetical protein